MDTGRPATVSIIIPTYNRRDSVLKTLESLSEQTYPKDRFDVIVVDDGSTDETETLASHSFPFRLKYFRQENAGATQARNTGATHTSADVLVFMDDDIVATAGMLEHLVHKVTSLEQTIALATLIPTLDGATSPFTVMYSRGAVFPRDVDHIGPHKSLDTSSVSDGCFVHFTECKTGTLCIKRQYFDALEMFQDPTGGWPNWDDVDFGYRAHLQGFRLWRSQRAIAYHHDHALRSLEANCRRQEQVSKSAARLFRRYPDLTQDIRQFRDKAPISLATDSPSLITRKALRSLVSSTPSVAAMTQLTHLLEKQESGSHFLFRLYRLILGASMYKGYRQGLRELAESES